MGLYLGSDQVRMFLDHHTWCVNLFSAIPIVNGVLLKSSEDYILKDSNGLYLTAKENG